MAPWNRSCDWCEVSMGYTESLTSEKIVNYGGAGNVTYHVCYYCRKFPTPEAVAYWKGVVADWAILGYKVVLGKITWDPPDVVINYTVKYGTDFAMPKIGWVG